MRNNIRMMKKVSAGVLAAAMAMSANASFLSIEAAGGFTEATLGNGSSANLINEFAPGFYSEVSWGLDAGNGLSSLELVDHSVDIDSLNTNYLVSELIHDNIAINGGPTLWLDTAVITGLLNLTNDADDGNSGIAAGFGSDTVVLPFDTTLATLFSVDFTETSNSLNGGTGECAVVDEDGIVGGASHAFATDCDDYFDYTVDNPGTSADSIPFQIPFYIDSVSYALTVFATTDAAGTELLPQNRFWTPEAESSSIFTWVRLNEVSVPEPLSIAIMGLGLMGIAGARKRRQS